MQKSNFQQLVITKKTAGSTGYRYNDHGIYEVSIFMLSLFKATIYLQKTTLLNFTNIEIKYCELILKIN